MREDVNESEGDGARQDTGAVNPAGKQSFIAIAVGVVIFATVMLLMLLAVKRAPSADAPNQNARPVESSRQMSGRQVVVTEFVSRVRTNVLGTRELEIKGCVRNMGTKTIRTADLRCRFGSASGRKTSFELPLIVNTRLDDLGDGRLKPMSDRKFSVRIGEFPEELDPEILELEVINALPQGQ